MLKRDVKIYDDVSREVSKMEEKNESPLPFVVMLITLATGVILLVSFLLLE
jgi:hypothetical protein